MSRITQKFIQLQAKNETAFMPFVVAGYPDFNTSLKITKTLAKWAHFLEVGFPYSDPLADGPIIQEADQIALKNGMTVTKVFKFISNVNKSHDLPIIILVYSNLVNNFGIENFYSQAKFVGVDGILIPDVPLEEADFYIQAAVKNKIDPIFIVAQTTTNIRLKKILKLAKGFLYMVSVLGVTGARKNFSPDTYRFLSRIKKHSDIPSVVGFGVSTNKQIKQFRKMGLDGFIVGSFLVSAIKKCSNGRNLKRFNKMVANLVRK